MIESRRAPETDLLIRPTAEAIREKAYARSDLRIFERRTHRMRHNEKTINQGRSFYVAPFIPQALEELNSLTEVFLKNLNSSFFISSTELTYTQTGVSLPSVSFAERFKAEIKAEECMVEQKNRLYFF